MDNTKRPSLFHGQNVMPYTLRVSYNKVQSEKGVVRKYVAITQEFYVGDARDLPFSKRIEIEKSEIQLLIDSLEQIKNEI
jgi:hypothetical protein